MTEQVVVVKPRILKLDDTQCVCCKAYFFPKDLDEMGRCPMCANAGLVPGAKQQQETVTTNARPTKDELKALIKEVLAEMAVTKEEPKLATKVCAKCKSEFTPSFPAEKFCSSCRESK